MALLDALTYIIDADNSKLNREVDKSDKKVEGFTEQMKTAEGRAKLAEEKIKGAFTRIGAAIVATVAAAKALETFNAHVQMVEQIRNTSDALGVAIEDVDAFGKAIERMGGDAQGARDSLTDMAEAIGEALQDTESGRAKAFKALGISLKDVRGNALNAVQGMVELAAAVEGLGREQAVFKIKELGITDNRTVELLLKGRQEVERMLRVQKEQGVVTKESAERVRVYSETLAKLRQSAGVATSGIVDWILPAITRFLEILNSVISWMNRHDTFVKGFFIGLTTILTALFLPAVISAAVAVWALIAPFLAIAAPIAAVVALFALLYDDVMNFLEGNDSLIGQISEKYPIVGETVKAMSEAVRTAFKWIGEAAGVAWEGIKNFASAVAEALAPLVDSFGDVFGAIMELAGSFQAFWAGVVGKIVDLLGIDLTEAFQGAGGAIGSVMDGIVAAIKFAVGIITSLLKVATAAISGIASAVSSVAGWLGFGDGDAAKAAALAASGAAADVDAGAAESMKAAKLSLNDAAGNPMNAMTSNAISNASNSHTETNVQVGQVTVQTQATDAQGISQSIGGELSGQLKNLQTDSASGVAR